MKIFFQTQLKSYGATTQENYSKSQAALTYNAVKAAMDSRILTNEELQIVYNSILDALEKV